MNIFEYAIKNKVRYDTKVGLIKTEDLYTLPLTSEKMVSLNSVAKGVNSELKASEEESFVTVATKSNTLARIKLEIVKHIIAERLEETEIKKAAATDEVRKQLITAIIADKQNDSLKEMSLEELRAELLK